MADISCGDNRGTPDGDTMRVALGGTFNVLHAGHMALFDKAFQIADHLLIGICSDEFASQNRGKVNPLSRRIEAVREVLDRWGGSYEIVVIDDPFGPAAEMNDLDAIVVSEETEGNAHIINEMRLSKGLYPLKIKTVPMLTDEKGEKISSTTLLSSFRKKIGVGSENPVKLRAVKAVLERLFVSVDVLPVPVDNSVGEQPMGERIREGAYNRAIAALMDNDFGVGIEAGVFEMEDGLYDVQWCAIVDQDGNISYGAGPAFRYPDRIAEAIRNGLSVGKAFPKVYGTERLGRSEGAIGFLTDGLLNRQKLTEQAVMAAMVPRLRKELYEE
ncbi:MAG: inosine/xanthosine triphosphatase [Candidatus Methanomethylophilaceae archaeon]|nr:inosine/xanthosine triphosphatase [Candidatus Methanomethylophilaceae archaeon]